jgi:hypothetical protein
LIWKVSKPFNDIDLQSYGSGHRPGHCSGQLWLKVAQAQLLFDLHSAKFEPIEESTPDGEQ